MTPVITSAPARVAHPFDARGAARRGARLRAEGQFGRASWYLKRARERAVAAYGETAAEVAAIDVELAETLRLQGSASDASALAQRAGETLRSAGRHARRIAEADAVSAMAQLAIDPEADEAVEHLAAASATLARIGRASHIAEHAHLTLASALVARSRYSEAAVLLQRRRDLETARPMPRLEMVELIDHDLVQCLVAARDWDAAIALTRDSFLRHMEGTQKDRDHAWAHFMEALGMIDAAGGPDDKTTALFRGMEDHYVHLETPPLPEAPPRLDALERRVAGIRTAAASGDPRRCRRAASRCLRVLPEVVEVIGPEGAESLVDDVSRELWLSGSLRRCAVLDRRLVALLDTLPHTSAPDEAELRARALSSLAHALAWIGLLDEAERMYRDVIERWRGLRGANPWHLRDAMRSHARVVATQGRHREAAAELAAILAMPEYDALLRSMPYQKTWLLLSAAEELQEAGMNDEAVPLAREALERLRRTDRPGDWSRLDHECRVLRLLAAAGIVDEAAAMRASLPEMPAMGESAEDETDDQRTERLEWDAWKRMSYRLELARCDLALGRPENAERLVRLVLSENRTQAGPNTYPPNLVYRVLGQALLSQEGRAFDAVRALEIVADYERNARFPSHPWRQEAERLLAEARAAAEAFMPGWPTVEQPRLFPV